MDGTVDNTMPNADFYLVTKSPFTT